MIFSYLLTLFGVCGLAVGVLVLLRAAKGGGVSFGGVQPIQVVGRQTLGAGANLLLVEVDGERMLIGVSRAGISVIRNSQETVQKPFGLSLSKPCSSSAKWRERRAALRQAQGERSGGTFAIARKRTGLRL